MALIDCPECGGKVSDSAEACPNCGYAVKKHFDTLKEEEKKKLEKKRIEEEREKKAKEKEIKQAKIESELEKLKPVFVGLAVLLILILLGITYYLVSTEDYREAVSATERAYERLDEFETELFTKKIIGNNIYYEINGNDYFIVMTDYTTMVYAQRQLTGKQATKYESYLQTKYGKTWDEVVADFAEYGFDELKKHDDGLDELVDEIRKEKEKNGGN